MSLLKTRTPLYQGQSKPPVEEPGALEWLKSLLCTPTPAYRRKPVHADEIQTSPPGDATANGSDGAATEQPAEQAAEQQSD